jgi:sigma-E factor negative regulatory protein RseC
MIEMQARVVSVEPGYAWIESERRSACGQCSVGDTCGVSSVGKLFGVRTQRMRLPDPLGVQAGDDIIVGLSEKRLAAAAAVTYMLPLVSMIGMALLSASLDSGQGAVALSSLGGLLGGLWLVRRRWGAGQAIAHYRPVILRRPTWSERTVEFKTRNAGVNHE